MDLLASLGGRVDLLCNPPSKGAAVLVEAEGANVRNRVKGAGEGNLANSIDLWHSSSATVGGNLALDFTSSQLAYRAFGGPNMRCVHRLEAVKCASSLLLDAGLHVEGCDQAFPVVDGTVLLANFTAGLNLVGGFY